jgi:iron complex outermembrane receptor protein
VAALVMATSAARGDEPEDVKTDPVRVTGERLRDSEAAPQAERALDEPAFVTSVDLRDEEGTSAAAAEVLARSAGVSVRSLGGLGAFASISVRGAPAAHTLVLVDGVPLSRVAFATLDLGAFELGTFERVDVYRGGVPGEWGGAALGGAVNFVTGVGPRPGEKPTRLVLAAGSFGARRLTLSRRDRFGGAWASTVVVGYAGAEGDYAYFDDHGTPLEPRDDEERTRVNNGYDQVDLGARVKWRRRGSSVELGQRLSWKQQGIPGPAGASAEATSLETWRVVADGHAAHGGALGLPGLRLGAGAHAVIETQRYRDPEGEVGLGMQDASYLTVATGATLAGSWATPRHLVGVALEPTVEWFREEDHMRERPGARGFRAGGAIAVSDALSLGEDGRVLVVPALRVDVLLSRPSGDTGQQVTGEDGPAARDDVYASPRLALRVGLVPGLALKASAGRYFRAPTVLELYGDRGVLVGNPTLTPETGFTSDLGLVVAPERARGPADRVFVEGALFWGRSASLIAWVPTSGRASVARNLGDAELRGVELTGQVRLWRTLTLGGNYTLLDTAQDTPVVPYDGKALPGRPRHELYLRADVARPAAGVELGAWVDLSALSGNYLDQGNLNMVPARRFLGAGARARWRGLAVGIEARNLLDERVEDVPLDPPPRPDLTSSPRAVSDALGYPLPGRSLMVTVSAEL